MKHLAAILLCALALGACQRPSPPVPRPRGFARVAGYGDSLRSVCIEGVTMDINAGATLSRPAPAWLDASFGRYGATLHLAVVHTGGADHMQSALRNRHERMSLNLSGRRAQVQTLTSTGGFAVEFVQALEPAPVPLQFVATNDNGILVSGAVVFAGPVEPADSLSPMLADLERQLRAIVNSLTCR